MSKPSLLPMFPLGIVTYPTVGLNLHIFEERYRQLIADALKTGITFGIIPVLESGELQKVGTEMKLVNIEKTYDDGRLDIKTLGLRRFEIISYNQTHDDKLYGTAEVTYLETSYESDPELYQVILDQIKLLFTIFDIDKSLPNIDEEFTTYKIVSFAALNIDQEIEFISLDLEIERQLFLVEHLNTFLPKAKEMEEMRKKVQLNGHFRNLLPPNLKEYP